MDMGRGDKSDILKSKIDNIANEPGIYRYLDKDGIVIYVGKAKKLRNRVLSYFNGKDQSYKTTVLVKNIVDVEWVVVDDERDALLLENNLIKKHKPKYNILLKDDKTYPWLKIVNENFPRVLQTRKIEKDGSIYFGPYTSIFMVRAMLELFKKSFKLRNCNHRLDRDSIVNGKYKVCLEYHLGNCLGPCEDKQSRGEYIVYIDAIKDILKGNTDFVIRKLKEEIEKCSGEYRFEEAHRLNKSLELIRDYRSKSIIVSNTITDVDVFSVELSDNFAVVNYLKVYKGAVVTVYTIDVKRDYREDKEEILRRAIVEIRERFKSDSKDILLSFPLDLYIEGSSLIVPKKGDKLKLIKLSEKNSLIYKLDKEKRKSEKNPEQNITQLMDRMKKDLQLSSPPKTIECFDNSNIQGHYPVSACVVFENGIPKKKMYRHYNVKTVDGPDDYATMEEVMYRRYSRMLKEETSLPDLIVVDGGKGQLSSAVKVLRKLNLMGVVAVIGIAKKLEEIFVPGDPIPLYVDKRSPTLKVIQHLRDEAHRFGITFHRDIRSKGFIKSELDSIKGIGVETKKKLFEKFKTVENIKNSSVEELGEVVGKSKALIIRVFFDEGSDSES